MKTLIYLSVLCITLAFTAGTVAQTPGNCNPAADGTCTKTDGTACKTSPNLPANDGKCKSTKLGHGDLVGSCECQPNAPAPAPAPAQKGDGGGNVALFVFLTLLTGWTITRMWPRLRAAQRS